MVMFFGVMGDWGSSLRMCVIFLVGCVCIDFLLSMICLVVGDSSWVSECSSVDLLYLFVFMMVVIFFGVICRLSLLMMVWLL